MVCKKFIVRILFAKLDYCEEDKESKGKEWVGGQKWLGEKAQMTNIQLTQRQPHTIHHTPHHTIHIHIDTVTHASSDGFRPRLRKLHSFFLEPHPLRFIIHVRLTTPILRISRGRCNIGVEIGRKVFRCATRQTQGSRSLAQALRCILASKVRVGVRHAPGVIIACRCEEVFCRCMVGSATADIRGAVGRRKVRDRYLRGVG